MLPWVACSAVPELMEGKRNCIQPGLNMQQLAGTCLGLAKMVSLSTLPSNHPLTLPQSRCLKALDRYRRLRTMLRLQVRNRLRHK